MITNHLDSCPLPSHTLSQMNRQFTQVLAKASKLSEVCYPQALDTHVMINLPAVMLVRNRTSICRGNFLA